MPIKHFSLFSDFAKFNFKAWEGQIACGLTPLEIIKDILFITYKLIAQTGTNKLCQPIALLCCAFLKNSCILWWVRLLSRNNYIELWYFKHFFCFSHHTLLLLQIYICLFFSPHIITKRTKIYVTFIDNINEELFLALIVPIWLTQSLICYHNQKPSPTMLYLIKLT